MKKKINKKNKRKKCQKMTTKLENASQNFRYRGGGPILLQILKAHIKTFRMVYKNLILPTESFWVIWGWKIKKMVFAISFSMTIRKLLRPVLESSFEMLSFDIWMSSVAIQLFELWRFIKKKYLDQKNGKKMKIKWNKFNEKHKEAAIWSQITKAYAKSFRMIYI